MQFWLPPNFALQRTCQLVTYLAEKSELSAELPG